MNKYAAYLFDGTFRVFPESSLHIVERAMKEKVPVRLEGTLVQGSAISDVKLYSSKNYGPHSALQAATDLFLEVPPSSLTFWKLILGINRQRQESGKPWLFPLIIKRGKEESGFTTPQDIVEFIDAEWESMGKYNIHEIPRQDYESRRLTEEFFKTEEGISYAEIYHIKIPSKI